MASTALAPSVRTAVGVPTAARRASVAAATLTAAAGLTGALPDLALVPLAIALAVGLPHGAVDHVVLMRRLGGLRGMAIGTVGYLAAAVATFWVADAAPVVTWSAFLLLSAWHFGTADREYLALAGERPSLLFALAAGAVPVGGFMIRGADVLLPLAEGLDPRVGVLLAPSVVSTVALVVVALTVAALANETVGGRYAAAAELALLGALFLTAPPLWAFGIYFGLWHALRHVARMVTEESPWADVLDGRGRGAALRRFAFDAALPTIGAVSAGVALVVIGRDMTTVAVTALALQVTAAVTFPHAATVAFLDRRGAQVR